MIGQVMDACNNHFIKTIETSLNEMTETGIQGTFSNKYFANQYILLEGTTLNDGVYKLTSATSNELSTILLDEQPDTVYAIYGLAVPKEFLEIVREIESWVASVGNKVGITSESIDDYSVSFDTSKGSAGDWKSAFSTRLNAYRKAYDTIHSTGNMRTKGW